MYRCNNMRRKTRPIKIPKQVSDVVSRIDTQDKRLDRRSQSSKVEIECYNFTGQDVKTTDQSGLCLVHKPIFSDSGHPELNGRFVIAKKIEIHEETQAYQSRGHNRDSIFSNMRGEVSDDIVETLKRGRHLKRRESSFYYTVKFKDIEDNGGGLYIHEVDLVISDPSIRDSFIHPSSREYLDKQIEQLYDASHTYSIEINDPYGEGAPYYVNLNGEVYTIHPTQDITTGDYARIIFKPPNEPAKTISQCTLDEKQLAEIGIFKKYGDADQYAEKHQLKIAELQREIEINKAMHENQSILKKSSTDDKASEYKIKELELKMENIRRQNDSDAVKATLESEKYLREKEKLELDIAKEREKHQRDLEEMRMKHYYESQSFQRKDSSEIVKFIPAIFGAGLAVFALLK